MTRPILYISGPYSAGNGRSTEDNIETARTYAVRAWEMGWAAITPHLNTAGFEHLCTGVEHGDWLAGDLAILDRLDPATDAMLLLPGWLESAGAMREYHRAVARGIDVIYPVTSPDAIPPATGRGVCEHYRQVHYETDSRDTCGSGRARCPQGKTCPIRGRCR
jgi:hypothetical protein